MTALVSVIIAVKVVNLVNSHVPNFTVLSVRLQVQERSMDLYLHEILFMLCFLYHSTLSPLAVWVLNLEMLHALPNSITVVGQLQLIMQYCTKCPFWQ